MSTYSGSWKVKGNSCLPACRTVTSPLSVGKTDFRQLPPSCRTSSPGKSVAKMYTEKKQHDGTGVFLPGLNCSSSHTAVTRELGTSRGCRALSAFHVSPGTHDPGASPRRARQLPRVGSASPCSHPALQLWSESPETPSGRVASPFPGAAKPPRAPQGLHPHPARTAQSGWCQKGPLGII